MDLGVRGGDGEPGLFSRGFGVFLLVGEPCLHSGVAGYDEGATAEEEDEAPWNKVSNYEE